MRWTVMAIMIICMAVLQSRLPALSMMGQAKAPLLMSCVIYYSLNHDFEFAVISAMLAGLAMDVLSPIPLGYSMIVFCLAALFMTRFRKLVVTDAVMTAALFGAAASAAGILALSVLLEHGAGASRPVGWVLMKAAGTALLALVVTPMVFVLARGLDKMAGNVETREMVDELL